MLTGAGADSSRHSPATCMPKTLMHGNEKDDSEGKSGRSNSILATSGTFQTISGWNVSHGSMIGRMVLEVSLPVNVIQVLREIEDSMKA